LPDTPEARNEHVNEEARSQAEERQEEHTTKGQPDIPHMFRIYSAYIPHISQAICGPRPFADSTQSSQENARSTP